MNTSEQAYADYLFNLADPHATAQSWDRLINHVPQAPQEVDYHNYWVGLNSPSKEVSENLIFDYLYDVINVSIHPMYETEFEAVGYSLAAKCRRRKEPKK